jgi:CheY-like chemotaxis protein
MAVNSIVLVENDPETVKTIRETLEHAGYTVHVFDDPNTAYQQAREILPSLFFINLSVPGTNGLEICKTIHHDSSLTNVPIVLLTIREGKFDPIYTKLYGIVAFVKKPFEIHELLAVAQEFSPMKPAPPQETTPMSGAEEEPAVPLSELEEEAGEALYGETGIEQEEEEEDEAVYQLSEEDLDAEQYGEAFQEDPLSEQEDTPYGEMGESLLSADTREAPEEEPVAEPETPFELEEPFGEESEEEFTDETAPSFEEAIEEEPGTGREEEEGFVPSLSYPEEEEQREEESLEGVEDELEEPHPDEDILEIPEELSGEALDTPGYRSDEELEGLLDEPAGGQREEGPGPEDAFTLDEVTEESARPAGLEDVRGRRSARRKSRLAPLLVLFLLVGLVSFGGFYFFFTDVPYKGKDSLTHLRDTLSRLPYLGVLISGDEETVVTEAPAPPVPPSAETSQEAKRPKPAPPVAPKPSSEPATEKETVLAVPERVIGEEKPAAVSPPPPATRQPRKVAQKTKAVSAYYIQFGAFSSDPNANRFAKKLENRGLDVFIKKVRLKSGKKAAAIKKEKRVDTAVFH